MWAQDHFVVSNGKPCRIGAVRHDVDGDFEDAAMCFSLDPGVV